VVAERRQGDDRVGADPSVLEVQRRTDRRQGARVLQARQDVQDQLRETWILRVGPRALERRAERVDQLGVGELRRYLGPTQARRQLERGLPPAVDGVRLQEHDEIASALRSRPEHQVDAEVDGDRNRNDEKGDREELDDRTYPARRLFSVIEVRVGGRGGLLLGLFVDHARRLSADVT
jgi:hypothetical protein